MNIRKLQTGLLAALLVAATTGYAVAQQPPAKSTPEKKAPAKKDTTGKALTEKLQYDAYEPSKRIRTGRQMCMQDEVSIDAWCAKKCKTGYQMEFSGKQAKCRAQTPLPPGVFPGPVQQQTGSQPRLPPPAKPEPPKPGA